MNRDSECHLAFRESHDFKLRRGPAAARPARDPPLKFSRLQWQFLRQGTASGTVAVTGAEWREPTVVPDSRLEELESAAMLCLFIVTVIQSQ